ncbi:MAG: hypothetical protein GQ581_01635 [Methyloprofundus sp.]|nr:hypothetical protein [Methyloprofundus sp.]
MTKFFKTLIYLIFLVLFSGCGAVTPLTLQFDYRTANAPRSLNGQSIQIGEFVNELGFSDTNQVKRNLKYTQTISSIVQDALKQELMASGYQVSQSNLIVSGKIHKMWGQNEITFNIKDTTAHKVLFEKVIRTNHHHDMLWDTVAHTNNLRELINLFLRDQDALNVMHTANSSAKKSQSIAAKDSRPAAKIQNNLSVSANLPVNDDFINRKKVALVIGNSAYAIGALRNPKNDAYDIAQALRLLGFQVILEINADQQQMDEAIARFGRALTDNSVGLFYYAGHGIQVKGANYLVPINSGIKKERDVKYKTVDLGVVLDALRNARTGLNIVLLDACRDNPFPHSSRSGARGLARVLSPMGTVIVYATSPGSTAADGTGRNGLFSKHLLKFISKPNMSIERVMKNVSRQVQLESKNQQVPWMESSFTGDFFFLKK